MAKDPNDPNWLLYLNKAKKCTVPTCPDPESQGKAWIKMVNPRTGKVVPYAWCQKNLHTYIPVCKRCYSEDAHSSMMKVAPKVAQVAQHNPQYVSNGPTQPIVGHGQGPLYLGPPARWLELQMMQLCRDASVRFGCRVSARDLLELLPDDYDETEPIEEPTKIAETVVSTPHIEAPTAPLPNLKEGYIRCPGCNHNGVKEVRLTANPSARCSICAPEQFKDFKPIEGM